MKKTLQILAFFSILFCSAKIASNTQLKYRIQCATSSEKKLLDSLHRIPDLKSFTLPAGNKIFFSGGYFDKYLDAESRLEKVKSLGFKNAFIRVFKYNIMLTKLVSKKYIDDLKSRFSAHDTEKDDSIAVDFAFKEKIETYTKTEVNTIRNDSLVIKGDKKIVEIVEKLDAVKDNLITEPPTFKILVARSKSISDIPDIVLELNNEVIKLFHQETGTVFALGFYGNLAAAKYDLAKYKKLTVEAEIIGLYKGRVISLNLANQLYKKFQDQQN